MIHLNPLLQREGLTEQLKELTLPQMYVANTLTDFLENRESCRPTQWWKAYTWGMALRTGGIHFVGNSLVSISDLDYTQLNAHIALLKDKGEGDVLSQQPFSMDNKEGRFKTDDDYEIDFSSTYRVGLVAIVYNPSRPLAFSKIVCVQKHFDVPDEPLSEQNAFQFCAAYGFA